VLNGTGPNCANFGIKTYRIYQPHVRRFRSGSHKPPLHADWPAAAGGGRAARSGGGRLILQMDHELPCPLSAVEREAGKQSTIPVHTNRATRLPPRSARCTHFSYLPFKREVKGPAIATPCSVHAVRQAWAALPPIPCCSMPRGNGFVSMSKASVAAAAFCERCQVDVQEGVFAKHASTSSNAAITPLAGQLKGRYAEKTAT